MAPLMALPSTGAFPLVLLLLMIIGGSSELESYPYDYNSTRVYFESKYGESGLWVSPREGRYMVTASGEEKWRAEPFHPHAGDQLVRANDHLVSSLDLHTILEHTEGTFVLPIISDSTSLGHKVVRFVKIEIFDAHSLTFRPTDHTRQRNIQRLMIEKHSIRRLQQESEEVKKQTRREKALQNTVRHENANIVTENAKIQQEEGQKNLEKTHQKALAQEMDRKQREKLRIDQINKETAKLLELEAGREDLAKARSKLEIEKVKITNAREKEKKMEENKKTVDKAQEEHQKIKDETKAKAEEREQNEKFNQEQKQKLAQKIKNDEAIRAAEKAAMEAAEIDKREEGEKMVEKKHEEERKRKWDFVDHNFLVRGPLGLFFVPETVPMTLDRDFSHSPLKRGDEMVEVNGMDLLEYESVEEIMAVLIESTWPKNIKFRRWREQPAEKGGKKKGGRAASGGAAPETIDEEVSSTILTFVSPPIVFGLEYKFEVAKYGIQRVVDCEERAIVLSEPLDACKPLKDFGDKTLYAGSLVLTQRGVCQFTQKSANIEGIGGEYTVVINNANTLLKMPAAKGKDNFKKSSVMISKDDGAFLRQIMKSVELTNNLALGEKLKIVARMSGEREGCKPLQGEGETIALPVGDNARGDGTLHIWNGQRIEHFDVMLGQFGKNLVTRPTRIVMGKPSSGCDERGFSVNVQNSIVIVERGECSFVDKARLIQKVGGIGMICVNSMKKPRLLKMPAGPDGATDVRIAGAMIEKGSWEKIKALVSEMPKGVSLFARAQVKQPYRED